MELNREFSKGQKQMTKKHFFFYIFNIFSYQKSANYTYFFFLTQVRTAKIRKQMMINSGVGVKKLLLLVGVSAYGN